MFYISTCLVQEEIILKIHHNQPSIGSNHGTVYCSRTSPLGL